ncbi:hypothetical protein LTR05_007773 [Lithohypha guttulata]|uniref:Uncharacterized protein n=1 Tax=Lithohypha guttulata TaxID=1690604 RepID=A0AAN7SU89_9EURO|nr:hypothetical protein LTR05_007773 [Lithohypha guttulata]
MSSSSSPKTLILIGLYPDAQLPPQVAAAFAKAGVTNLALIGPSQSYLEEVKNRLLEQQSGASVVLQEVDITSPESVGIASHNIRAELGAWDILVNFLSPPAVQRTSIRGADEDEWWNVFERNVKSLHHIGRHFFSKMRNGAVLINVLSSNIGGGQTGKNSSESASQLAAVRVVEYLGKENESTGLRVVNVHAATSEQASSNLGSFSNGTIAPEDFLVWCASDEAAFLGGKTVSASAGIGRLLEASRPTKPI